MNLIIFIVFVCLLYHVGGEEEWKEPTVVIAVLARNKGHALPYFLTLLEQQEYPKDRLALWIRSDHNTDNTDEVLSAWIESVRGEYGSVDYSSDEGGPRRYADETSSTHWPPSRFNHVIRLREQALEYARRHWADYVLMVDCDVLLYETTLLKRLIGTGKTIVAPLLRSDGLYSNFWSGMTEQFYYQRTDDYGPIVHRERLGCFPVPMVHSCVLIDLRRVVSDRLTYVPSNGPLDDIIAFALSANRSNVEMNVCNDVLYGYVPVPVEHDTSPAVEHERQRLLNIRLEAIADGFPPLRLTPRLEGFIAPPEKDSLGFDVIYMINLIRRPERRDRMQASFEELGLEVSTFDAVDGRALDETTLDGLRILPEYRDPYHGRNMTLGEIGCFLSHHRLWLEQIKNNHQLVLVLEDDIRFEPFFRQRVRRLIEELEQLGHDNWDLVYLGRKKLQDQDEPQVEGSTMLVHAGYSYWTLGYALTLTGAKKLIDARPLENLLPVDEYLPILFDRHPNDTWKNHFPKRDLIGLSASPLLLYPTHYTGEKGYVSDTEDSLIIDALSDNDQSVHTHNDL